MPHYLLPQLIQILSKFKQHSRLFTNRIWHTHSSRPKRKFCTDTFMLTIRESRARDVYPTIDDVTAPYEPLYVIVSVILGFQNLSNMMSFNQLSSEDLAADRERILARKNSVITCK